MAKKIAVVGSGVGGLSSAARLASKGFSVEVFEKLNQCGGRNHMLVDQGFKFDMGPSFVLMPDFFEEVFSYCGEDIRDYLNLVAIDPSYKIFYPDGDVLTVYKDSNRTKEELERIEPGSSKGFDKFIAETSRLYETVRPLLLKCFTPAAALNPKYWGLLGKIRALESYWQLASRYFKSEKLTYAFTFEAMFMGISPFEAPAFYSIISYTDHVQKIFHPMGGMYEIPKALERMCSKFGVAFHYSSEVERITEERNAVSLRVNNQDRLFDKVIVNADYAYAQQKLLERLLPKYRYSCSVYLLYLGLKEKIRDKLAHHNLFFSSDLRKNLKQIFDTKEMPLDPSFYVHVPTVTDASLAPKDKDIFYILVPVPNMEGGAGDFALKENALRRVVFDKLKQALNISLEDLIEVEHRFYPKDFIDRYNIHNGATFGLAHNLMQSAFFRPVNFDQKIKGLYFVGASTQPGGGLPVVIASSRIVADLITQGF